MLAATPETESSATSVTDKRKKAWAWSQLSLKTSFKLVVAVEDYF